MDALSRAGARPDWDASSSADSADPQVVCRSCGDLTLFEDAVFCAGGACSKHALCRACARDFEECEALLCRELLCADEPACRRPCLTCGATVCSDCGTDVCTGSGSSERQCFDGWSAARCRRHGPDSCGLPVVSGSATAALGAIFSPLSKSGDGAAPRTTCGYAARGGRSEALAA